MSQKKIKQMRRQIRKQKEIFREEFVRAITSFPFWQRVKLAFLIIFKKLRSK
jgi:hypothetical protein